MGLNMNDLSGLNFGGMDVGKIMSMMSGTPQMEKAPTDGGEGNGEGKTSGDKDAPKEKSETIPEKIPFLYF